MFANFHLLHSIAFIHLIVINFDFQHLIILLFESGNYLVSFSSLFIEKLSPTSYQLSLLNSNATSLCWLEIEANFFGIRRYLLLLQPLLSFSFLNILLTQISTYSIQYLPCSHSLSMLVKGFFLFISC